ncbi:MAG: hypothetical protein DLM72_19355 [Candidatus Nitrosopolaris wilkensis]|nr:MAG: hypothetical protein DLM72_19355 [Candidatus Nitrosopolaris wilkensis]
MGKTYAVLMSYKEASNIDPKFSSTRGTKGVTVGTLKKYEDDLHSAEKCLEVNSNDAFAWYQKGAALNNLNRYREAIRSFERALEIRSGLAIAWYNKGSALVALGEYEEAVKSFDMGYSN